MFSKFYKEVFTAKGRKEVAQVLRQTNKRSCVASKLFPLLSQPFFLCCMKYEIYDVVPPPSFFSLSVSVKTRRGETFCLLSCIQQVMHEHIDNMIEQRTEDHAGCCVNSRMHFLFSSSACFVVIHVDESARMNSSSQDIISFLYLLHPRETFIDVQDVLKTLYIPLTDVDDAGITLYYLFDVVDGCVSIVIFPDSGRKGC